MTFEEFAETRLTAVLRFAGVLTGDRALAEDVVQEVLIRAHARWRKIDRLDRYADRDALLAELSKLPRRQRAVLVLRYYEGLSDNEIADALGCAPGTVRGYASRALGTLRIELREPALYPEGNQ